MGSSASKTLILMRHAKSEWGQGLGLGGRDIDRPLNARGVADSERMASWLGARLATPIHMLVSPARRAQQTAAALRKKLEVASFETHEPLYLAEQSLLRQIIADAELDNMLIVGHNPGMEELVEFLQPSIRITSEFSKIMPTGALYAFELPLKQGKSANARLMFHQRPKQLAKSD